jgi:hypothetical protein
VVFNLFIAKADTNAKKNIKKSYDMHIQFYDLVWNCWELYDISFKCSQWNWILKAHSFVNEFKLELNYSSIAYYSRNKQASANL